MFYIVYYKDKSSGEPGSIKIEAKDYTNEQIKIILEEVSPIEITSIKKAKEADIKK